MLQPNFGVFINMDDLWYKRSIGIKIYGFDSNPHELALKFNVLSDVIAKGDAHGSRNTHKENQIHLIKLLEPKDSWGDTLLSLISNLGGVESLLGNIKDLKPKSHFVIVNKPLRDLDYQQSNDISKECIHLLNQLDCNVSFNFF
jgi:hypothetical protein